MSAAHSFPSLFFSFSYLLSLLSSSSAREADGQWAERRWEGGQASAAMGGSGPVWLGVATGERGGRSGARMRAERQWAVAGGEAPPSAPLAALAFLPESAPPATAPASSPPLRVALSRFFPTHRHTRLFSRLSPPLRAARRHARLLSPSSCRPTSHRPHLPLLPHASPRPHLPPTSVGEIVAKDEGDANAAHEREQGCRPPHSPSPLFSSPPARSPAAAPPAGCQPPSLKKKRREERK